MTKQLVNSTLPVTPAENQVFLERPRVDGLLEKALLSPVVTVVAGAGYGKTHAVYSYLGKVDGVVIWVQLSEWDNLGWRFWESYTGAIGAISKQLGSNLQEIGFPETTHQFDRYATLSRHELIPQQKYIVVLDDFHFIREKSILRFMDRSTALPFSNVIRIIISRNEPAISTVSLLSKGLLSGITVEDLRFSEQEISDYFELQNTRVSPEDLSQIYHDTEGWALAVSLAARELRNRGPEEGTSSARSLLRMSSFRKIEDELFAAIGEDLRKFLIKLSLIEQWPLDLLEKIVPRPGLLEDLDNIGSFIRYDTYLHGYRIHHLFIEYLREKQGQLGREEIREVYNLAAQWCIRHNLRMDAAIDYERAENYRGIIDITNSFPRLLPNGVASFFLEIVDRLRGKERDGDGDFLFLRYIIRARLLLCLGRFDESTGEVREVIRIHEALPPNPISLRLLSAAYNHLGIMGILTCRFTRDYDFIRHFKRAEDYHKRNPEPVEEPVIQGNLTSYILQIQDPVEDGEIERALNACIPGLAYAANSLNGYLYGADSLARAELAYYQGDLSNAERFARQAVFKGREKKQYAIENRGLFYLMRISLLTGSFADIQELQRQLEAQLEIPEYQNRHTIHDIGMGRFYVQLGLTGKLAPWLRSDLEEGELNSLFHSFPVMVKAKYLFVEKQYTPVLQILGNEKSRRDLGSFLLGKLEMTILEAAVWCHLDDGDRAIENLAAAYKLASGNSLDMAFIEMGDDMRILADAALNDPRCTIPRSWLETIRSKASAYSKRIAVMAEQFQRQEDGGVKLSIRETEVLADLSQGLTREEIASDSAISINAVKSVISSLYSKLGAVNRADAVRIATNLGLLKNNE
ncbi:MAG: LuxR C-terminal-related transcriptional regulator [Spirochaetaceae bacterium]|jgi:LuxR family maltose regulon positive regulatory protein|nr:LuxR C-terminal-related transcriptional regulator [Spirochaetaceae bacterium]